MNEKILTKMMEESEILFGLRASSNNETIKTTVISDDITKVDLESFLQGTNASPEIISRIWDIIQRHVTNSDEEVTEIELTGNNGNVLLIEFGIIKGE